VLNYFILIQNNEVGKLHPQMSAALKYSFHHPQQFNVLHITEKPEFHSLWDCKWGAVLCRHLLYEDLNHSNKFWKMG